MFQVEKAGAGKFRVARASRVLAKASRLRELSKRIGGNCARHSIRTSQEVRFGGTPKPARETRALPGFTHTLFLIFAATCAVAADPTSVKVAPVARGDVIRYVTLPGNLRAKQQATLYAKVAGYVTKVAVDKGDAVKVDQLLAELEVPELIADFKKYEADAQVAEIDLKRLTDAHSDYGIGLSWRVGPGGLFDTGRIHAGEARLETGELERAKLRDEITRQVVEAHASAHSLADQIEFSKKALSAAEQSLKLARQRQQFGVGEVLENIQAEQDLTRARLDYLTAITGHNRAQFALRRAVAGGGK